MGNTLEELGRLDEAETSYTQAIALEPDSENAAQNMVKLPVGQLDLKILALLDKALLVQSESVKNQASYYFFKANLLKHKGLMERSFDEFCKANKLRWEEVREQFATYDRACTGNLNRIRQWTPNAPELVESGLTKLFLVGPSKSGKSSLEHALSRSSQVKPLYEGIRYSGLSKAVVNGKDPYETLYEKHFFQSEDEFLRQGYKVVTSTNPDNIFYSDYLIDMLPNTFFLIIKRNSRDLASEIFTAEYTNGNFYSYHPNGISKYLCVYNKICEALALKVPDRCITINFEDIMNSPEDTVERIGDLVCRNLEVSRLKKYVTSFTSESLFRNHF
jgi:tetratricopeptide (TPR) repeat protein